MMLLAAGCSRAGDSNVVADSHTVADSSAPASPKPAANDRVTEKGFGNVLAGMSVANAEAILGASLGRPAGADSMQCRMAQWAGAPAGVRLMIEGNRIVRVDVGSAGVRTAEGAQVGSAEPDVLAMYTGRVTSMPAKYDPAGHFLVVVPATPADSGFRLIFETDGKAVMRYRAGQRPQVEYVEACG